MTLVHAQVALTRKGFKNQIKTLLWRNRSATSAAILSSATSNGGADVPATPLRTPRASTTGVFSSLSGSQAQLRQLADTAFLVQDFHTAASTLRTLAVDYRSEGLWHSYASVQVQPAFWAPAHSYPGGPPAPHHVAAYS